MSKHLLCEECGPSTVSHNIEKTNALLAWAMMPLLKPIDAIWRRIAPFAAPILNRITPPFLNFLVFLGLGKFTYEPDEKDSLMTRCLWEEANRRGIEMRQFRLFGLRRDFFISSYKGDVNCFEGLPRPVGKISESLSWVDDKGILKKKFEGAGVPIAKGGTCSRISSAIKLFRSLTPPVITKPSIGSASRHTTTHIETEDELIRAFKVARKLSPWVVVEEELLGAVYRATVIGGKVVGVIERDPPFVTGDGKRNIQELIRIENEHPLRQGPIFHPITIGSAEKKELRRLGLSPESVPKKDTRATLNQKVNWSGGGSTTDVTDETHPENIRLFERIGQFLDDPIVGIDFVIGDIRKPWMAQKRCGVIECNSLPFIDTHHFPFNGKPRNAIGAVWDLIFPESKPR
jgi:D-alanine-D-alanine ligase-like ATP-grasp enzyme